MSDRSWIEQHALVVAGEMWKALEAGTAAWVRPWAPGEAYGTAPFNPTSGKRYKGGNALWLSFLAQSKGYNDPRWMTFKQAQSLGGQVRKGEKSVVIEYWKWPNKKEAEDGQDADAENTRRGPSVFFPRVFNASQIDGLEPLPPMPSPAWARHAEAEAVIQRLGVPVTYAGGQAFYSPSDDRIQMPPEGLFNDRDGFYSTLLHECGHATGHPSRLNRDLSHRYGTPGYAAEELRAELASMLLAQRLGTGHDPSQHQAYIANWIQLIRDKPRELFAAARDAEAICDHLGVGPDYDLTARAALLGGEEHAQRMAVEQEATRLRQQRDAAAALLTQATAIPSPETLTAEPESAPRRRPSL